MEQTQPVICQSCGMPMAKPEDFGLMRTEDRATNIAATVSKMASSLPKWKCRSSLKCR